MKNFARLALSFTLFFTGIFAAAALLNFLALWVEAAKTLPFRQGAGGDFVASGSKALPAALYITVLLSLSYTVRKKMPAALSIIGIFALAWAFTLGFTLVIGRLDNVNLAPPAFRPLRGEPGLMLSRADISMILLKGTDEAGGPRITAIPGQPLIYQETALGPDHAILALPSLPFRTDKTWLISSLAIDFDLVSREFKNRLGHSFFSFCLYAGSLIFFLVSIRFLLGLSQWPLVNLFLGALAFRGILALEVFLDTPETADFLKSFLEGLSGSLLTPLVFCSSGILVTVYTVLVWLARGREKKVA
ncbi:MAG: hypothetical protein LBQ67_06270 [Treponema sp.]|jgi:hypothetical protein|nr:hypothetical protein [Treponema sp.]